MIKRIASVMGGRAPWVLGLALAVPSSISALFAIVALRTVGPAGASGREYALVIGIWLFLTFGGGVTAWFYGRRLSREFHKILTISEAFPEDGRPAGAGDREVDIASMNDALFGLDDELDLRKTGRKLDKDDLNKQLIAEKRRFEAFLRGIGDSVTIVDLDYRIIYMNDTVKKIFGDRIGEQCYNVFEHKTDICAGCPIKRSYITGGVETSLRRVYTKDDKLLYMENTGSPIRDEEGKIIAGIELARDVSQRIRLERNVEIRSREVAAANEELRLANEELQNAYRELKGAQNALIQSEKMASLGVLVAGVAHEINNPTNFIYGSMPLLEENIASLLTLMEKLEIMPFDEGQRQAIAQIKRDVEYDYVREDLRKIVKNVTTGAQRIKEIVQNLRTFSRVDSGEKAEINVHEGLDSTLEILHHEYKNRIEIVKDYGPLPSLVGSPGKLNQVFMNILHNAIQSITDKGRVVIRTFTEGGNAVIEIEDTGVGIPEEALTHIFDPFFTTKKVGEGTGLGLSISYSIIQDHKGKLLAYSKAGEGTRMRIELPL